MREEVVLKKCELKIDTLEEDELCAFERTDVINFATLQLQYYFLQWHFVIKDLCPYDCCEKFTFVPIELSKFRADFSALL